MFVKSMMDTPKFHGQYPRSNLKFGLVNNSIKHLRYEKLRVALFSSALYWRGNFCKPDKFTFWARKQCVSATSLLTTLPDAIEEHMDAYIKSLQAAKWQMVICSHLSKSCIAASWWEASRNNQTNEKSSKYLLKSQFNCLNLALDCEMFPL